MYVNAGQGDTIVIGAEKGVIVEIHTSDGRVSTLHVNDGYVTLRACGKKIEFGVDNITMHITELRE